MSDTRVLVLVGSLRADSFNRRLAETIREQSPTGVTVEIASGLDKLPFYNEDLGSGYCVADTKGAPLKLETCDTKRKQQIFTMVPAGDSGQFELHGMYGVIRVHNGKITTSGTGRTGLQTILYAN